MMNGAESVFRTLLGGGVNVCFTNPDTLRCIFSPHSTLSRHPLPLTHSSSSSSIFAALRSGRAKPSVNQP